MSNESLLTGIQRLWQHVLIALNTKANTSHSHGVATASSSGFMSASDKSKLDAISSLPSTSSSQNGMFLIVVNGTPTWSNVPNAEEARF